MKHVQRRSQLAICNVLLLSISFADAQMLALRRRLCFFNSTKRAWTHSWLVPDHL